MKTLLLILLCFSLNAQEFSTYLWHEGLIVTNKDTLKGAVSYNMALDVVILLDDKISVYPASKAFYFELYDIERGLRQFYSLYYDHGKFYSRPTFFEVQREGKLTFITREQVVRGQDWNGYTRRVLHYEFFFITLEGKLTHLKNPRSRRQLLKIMSDKKKEIRKVIRLWKLHYWNVNDMIRLTAFYNVI